MLVRVSRNFDILGNPVITQADTPWLQGPKKKRYSHERRWVGSCCSEGTSLLSLPSEVVSVASRGPAGGSSSGILCAICMMMVSLRSTSRRSQSICTRNSPTRSDWSAFCWMASSAVVADSSLRRSWLVSSSSTYTTPSSFALASVPRLMRPRTASTVVPRDSAASFTVYLWPRRLVSRLASPSSWLALWSQPASVSRLVVYDRSASWLVARFCMLRSL